MLDNEMVSNICLSAIVISFFVCVTISDYFKYKYKKDDNSNDDNMKEG